MICVICRRNFKNNCVISGLFFGKLSEKNACSLRETYRAKSRKLDSEDLIYPTMYEDLYNKEVAT